MKTAAARRGRIRNELILGLVAVVLLSGLSTYAIVIQSSRRDFDSLVEKNDIAIAKSFAASLADFYAENGSWQGVGTRIGELRQHPEPSVGNAPPRSPERRHPKEADIPLVLTDAKGEPIYNGVLVRDGDRTANAPARLRIAEGEPIVVEGETIAYVFFKSMIFKSYNPQEEAFISSLTKSIGLSVSIGLILTLAFGTLLASRFAKPIAALDSAVRTIAGGDLSARVGIRRRDEIGSLAGNFNLMADKLQATESARQNLLADIAHELRTPVSIIQANLEMILDGVYAADRERMKSLYEETRILADLIGDLRSLSDLEAGIAGMRTERIDLAALVEETCGKLRPLFDEKSIALDTPLETKELPVMAEADKLRQVFRNVLGNALKYAPSGSAVAVSFELEAGFVAATIADQGEGVPEGDTERIFERFYRVDSSRSRESGGRGLGLAISRKIVEACGGTIGARNRAPQGRGAHGLAVRIELPLA